MSLEDDELLDEISHNSGIFLLTCPPLSALDGKLTIRRDFPGEVCILMGSLKNFDHFMLNRNDGNNFILHKGTATQFLPYHLKTYINI